MDGLADDPFLLGPGLFSGAFAVSFWYCPVAPVYFTGKQGHGAYMCGVGWDGVGMVTFLALAHMSDATQLMGWGGDGA